MPTMKVWQTKWNSWEKGMKKALTQEANAIGGVKIIGCYGFFQKEFCINNIILQLLNNH